MGLFSKKELSLSEEIDYLKQQEKILGVKKQYTPQVLNKLILFFIFFALALFSWFEFKPHVSVGILSLIAVLLFFYKPYSKKKIALQIKETRLLKDEKAKELKQSLKSMDDLYKKLKVDEIESKKTSMDYESYPAMCRMWDKLTGSYIYNPRALICPNCKSNNGLYDTSKPILYYCPNCKNRITSNFENAASYVPKKND